MRLRSRVVFVVSVLLAGMALPAAAVPLVQEDFSYAVGELNGQSGGFGFSGAWTASVGRTQVVDPGTALAYAVPGGSLIDVGNRALLVEGPIRSDTNAVRGITDNCLAICVLWAP